jgi:hypothetical protein
VTPISLTTLGPNTSTKISNTVKKSDIELRPVRKGKILIYRPLLELAAYATPKTSSQPKTAPSGANSTPHLAYNDLVVIIIARSREKGGDGSPVVILGGIGSTNIFYCR